MTFYTLFVIDLKTRRVEIVGTTVNPTGAFMAQLARNLTDVENGFVTQLDGWRPSEDATDSPTLG